MQGDAGVDIFVFAAGSGSDADIISNFTLGEDLMDLSAFGLTGMGDLTIGSDGMGQALITLTSGDTILLGAIDPATLTSGDFIF